MASKAEIYKNVGPLHQHRDEAWKCVRCGLCRMVNPEKVKSQKWSDQCPAGTRYLFEAYFGSGKQEMLRALSTTPPELAMSEKLQHAGLAGNWDMDGNKGLERWWFA